MTVTVALAQSFWMVCPSIHAAYLELKQKMHPSKPLKVWLMETGFILYSRRSSEKPPCNAVTALQVSSWQPKIYWHTNLFHPTKEFDFGWPTICVDALDIPGLLKLLLKLRKSSTRSHETR